MEKLVPGSSNVKYVVSSVCWDCEGTPLSVVLLLCFDISCETVVAEDAIVSTIVGYSPVEFSTKLFVSMFSFDGFNDACGFLEVSKDQFGCVVGEKSDYVVTAFGEWTGCGVLVSRTSGFRSVDGCGFSWLRHGVFDGVVGLLTEACFGDGAC